MQLERWDETADVTFDKTILNELVSLRFIDERAHVTIVGPVAVGKTFLARAIGHSPVAASTRSSPSKQTACSSL